MTDWQNLSEQLRKLGVKLGGSQINSTSKNKRFPIEAVLDCQETKTPSGTTLSVKTERHFNYAQGSIKLNPDTSFKNLLRWANIPDTKEIGLENLVFLDTETTGLSGGTGTMAFMVGVGKFENGNFLLEQFFLRHPAEEEAFLHALSLFCKDMKAVVSYNGKAFDIPILNTRHVLNRIPSPFLRIHHIDLLTISRQIWRLRLNQCRLSDIEHNILGFYREGGEVPGYLAPEFYKDYLKSGDARPLKGLFYHNLEDVASLAALFSLLAKILEDPSSKTIDHSNDVYSVGRIFEKMDDFDTASKLYTKSVEAEKNQELSIQYIMRHAALLKKNGKIDEALNLWNQAAALNSVEALVNLAKYHEHQSKNIDLALMYTQQAMDLIVSGEEIKPEDLANLNKRKERLDRKRKKALSIKTA